ncbi:ammonium transporter 2 member 4-like [Salvia divinorum]|uniref:Ammonium transporter 2 member 4-like n=1 Tax=Salvia divinorum TaxID=28513 RepID=A0ABD1HZH5_SALDI
MKLAGDGMGWTGFNGGTPYAANAIASLAVINTHVCAAASLLTWLLLDMTLSGLVCITPAAGLVQCWAAMLMGLVSGSLPCHAVAGALGAVLTGVFASPELCRMSYGGGNYVGLAYALGLRQMAGVVFVVCLNVAAATVICLVVRVFVALRMSEEEMEVHGEVAYGIDEQTSFLGAKVNSIYEVAISKTPTYEMP